MSECVFVCVCVWCSSAGSSGSHHRSSRGGKRGAFTQPRRGNKRGKAAAAGRWCVGGWNWRRPEKGENHPACRGKWKKKPVFSFNIIEALLQFAIHCYGNHFPWGIFDAEHPSNRPLSSMWTSYVVCPTGYYYGPSHLKHGSYEQVSFWLCRHFLYSSRGQSAE